MSLIQLLKFRTLKTGCFKMPRLQMPRLQTPCLQTAVFQWGLQLALAYNRVCHVICSYLNRHLGNCTLTVFQML